MSRTRAAGFGLRSDPVARHDVWSIEYEVARGVVDRRVEFHHTGGRTFKVMGRVVDEATFERLIAGYARALAVPLVGPEPLGEFTVAEELAALRSVIDKLVPDMGWDANDREIWFYNGWAVRLTESEWAAVFTGVLPGLVWPAYDDDDDDG